MMGARRHGDGATTKGGERGVVRLGFHGDGRDARARKCAGGTAAREKKLRWLRQRMVWALSSNERGASAKRNREDERHADV